MTPKPTPEIQYRDIPAREAELRRLLITCDGVGKERKEAALEELTKYIVYRHRQR
jgi:hypothetical protein